MQRTIDNHQADLGPVWLIANSASGSHDGEAIAAIAQLHRDAGRPVSRIIELGTDPLPTAQDAQAAGLARIILFGGDGTITSATDKLSGWDGELLVLPGGTMNLLSRALHGELSPVEIVRKALTEPVAILRVPTVKGGGHCALAGIIAGPTTAWGDVREAVRSLDLPQLPASVGEAIAETVAGDSVAVDGADRRYQAVYLEPHADGLSVRGVLTRGPLDLIYHGIAWLSGDFRNGPNEDLGVRRTVSLTCESEMGLLVDGERAQGAARLDFIAGESEHRYLSCRGEVVWS